MKVQHQSSMQNYKLFSTHIIKHSWIFDQHQLLYQKKAERQN